MSVGSTSDEDFSARLNRLFPDDTKRADVFAIVVVDLSDSQREVLLTGDDKTLHDTLVVLLEQKQAAAAAAAAAVQGVAQYRTHPTCAMRDNCAAAAFLQERRGRSWPDTGAQVLLCQ